MTEAERLAREMLVSPADWVFMLTVAWFAAEVIADALFSIYEWMVQSCTNQ